MGFPEHDITMITTYTVIKWETWEEETFLKVGIVEIYARTCSFITKHTIRIHFLYLLFLKLKQLN
jgi:hypothetical protein